jgi:hypothetical protein
MRRGVSRAEVAALRKLVPMAVLNPVAIIVRTIVTANPTSCEPAPRTALQDALIAAAHAAYVATGRVQRVILDNMDPAGGRMFGPSHSAQPTDG